MGAMVQGLFGSAWLAHKPGPNCPQGGLALEDAKLLARAPEVVRIGGIER